MNSWAADICLRWLKWLAGGLVWGFRMSLVRELVGAGDNKKDRQKPI